MTMQCTILESSADIMKNDYGIIALPISSFYFYVHFYIYQLFKYQSYKLLPPWLFCCKQFYRHFKIL